MEARELRNVSPMPAPTWRHLHMNDVDIDIPAGLEPVEVSEFEMGGFLTSNEHAFRDAMRAAQTAWNEEHADDPAPAPDDAAEELGGTALSAYQAGVEETEATKSLMKAFGNGMGGDATRFLRDMNNGPTVVEARAGKKASVAVRINAEDTHAKVATLDLVANEGSELEVTITVDSPDGGTGVTGSSLRVFAGRDSKVTIRRTQTLDEGWIDLDDMGLFADANAVVEIEQTVLGAGQAYTGLAGDLRGDCARVDVSTRYLGHGDQKLDFNYILRHHGKKTECNLYANGVLAGRSTKTLRGTIDLIRGCKGAVGQETDTVLLVDEDVVNKTVPTILCNEDDVMGNHGATIGHVAGEQLFYLASRGLSAKQAESMFITASLERAAIEAPDDETRAAVFRLGNSLVDDFEEICA